MRRALQLDLVWKHGHRKPLIPVHEEEVTTKIVHLVGHGPLAAPRQVSLDGTEQLAGVAAKPSMRTVEHRVLLTHLTNGSSLEKRSKPHAASLPAARAGQTEGPALGLLLLFFPVPCSSALVLGALPAQEVVSK